MNILVLGGSSAVGELIVKDFSQNPFVHGQRIIATYCRNQAAAKGLASRYGVDIQQVDLSSAESSQTFFANLKSQADALDLIIFCPVAKVDPKPFHLIDKAMSRAHFDVTYLGLLNTLQGLLKNYRNSEALRILNIGSILQTHPERGFAYYSSLKQAGSSLLEAFLLETHKFGFSGKTIHCKKLDIGQSVPDGKEISPDHQAISEFMKEVRTFAFGSI